MVVLRSSLSATPFSLGSGTCQPVKQAEEPREVVWTPLVWKFVTQLALTSAFFAVELVVGELRTHGSCCGPEMANLNFGV